MIGAIESYDPENGAGTIKNSEGQLINFQLADWVAGAEPEEGDAVRFEVAADGHAITVDLAGAYLEPPKPVKYKYLAAFLALFLGWAGVHRHYLGYYRLGAAQLLVTVVLVVTGFMTFAFLWSFIEAFLLFGGHLNKDAKGRPLK